VDVGLGDSLEPQALFPGTVYVPEHQKKPQYLREVSNNVYARARFDRVIIDAKNERTP
jgi:hypothetical protein